MSHPNHYHHNQLSDKMQEYKGMFFNENKDKIYYEGGAHFLNRDLVKKLNALIILSSDPDRSIKLDAHQKTKSFNIQKISLKAVNKIYPKREYESHDQKKVNKNKSKRLIFQIISNDKEECISTRPNIHTEVNKIQMVKQMNSKVKLKPINFNKVTKKKFPIIKQQADRFTSRNNGNYINPKNNSLINPYLSIEVLGGGEKQLSERKLSKIIYKPKKNI